MLIELRNIKTNERLSQETNCYTADIYVDGKKVAYASNTGQGGPDEYRVIDEVAMSEASRYCRSLPPVQFQGHTLKMDLELYIGQLLEAKMKEKLVASNNRRLQNDMTKGLVFVSKDDTSGGYQVVIWKGWDIPKLLANPNGPAHIKKSIDKVLAEGGTILNTNLGNLL